MQYSLEVEELEDPFVWDGSYLGDHLGSIIQWKVKSRDFTYYRIRLNGFEVTCMLRGTDDPILAIFDEIKPLFNIEKNGCHLIRIGGRLYIISRALIFDGGIIYEEPSIGLFFDKNNKIDEQLQLAIQNIFMFREICGMKLNCDKHVRMRYLNDRVYPISLVDTQPDHDLEHDHFTSTVLKKWFSDTEDFTVMIKNLRMIKSDMDEVKILEQVTMLRFGLDKIIRRVNPDYVWLTLILISRIRSYLQI